MKDLVSIIVPMYNCSLYIEKCIMSLISQTYNQLEILIVDDGSTDNCGDIVKAYARSDARVKYFYQENSGPGRARNKAIEESQGKYLLFVDSDDYLGEDYIQDMVQCAETDHAELVIGGYTLFYENNNRKEAVIPEDYKRNDSEEWAYRISSCCSRLYLKAFWQENNLQFHENKSARAEDIPIVLYSNAMAKQISVVHNAGYFYRQHQYSAMNLIKKGIVFRFPYDAFKSMYLALRDKELHNSREFYDIGIVKVLANFEFVIYRRTDSNERKAFNKYVKELIKDDKNIMLQEWKMHRRSIQFPVWIKFAIDLFWVKYYKR